MIIRLINEETGRFKGKKLIASGSESLSFMDINNNLKNTYTKKEVNIKHKNLILNSFMDNLQLFFHGNTHATNFKFMLNFLESNKPEFENYENASLLLNQNLKSFDEYINDKAEMIDDKISPKRNELCKDLRYPNLQNYYKISLD
jgi:hypothetical protein